MIAALWQPLGLVWSCALLGLLVGSFLNVVIARLPRMMTLAWSRDCLDWLAAEAPHLLSAAGLAQAGHCEPDGQARHPEPAGQADPADPASPPGLAQDPGRATPRPVFNLARPPSCCPRCSAPIRPWQNVPVLSWLVLRGRCAACRAPIGVRYPFVEAVTAVFSAAVAATFGESLATVGGLLLVWGLLALTFIDLDTLYLPDDLTLPLVWLGLLFHLFDGRLPLADALLGAVVGYLLLWTVCAVFRLLTGKEGMGAGDFKLLAALGAWLGWAALPGIILLSSLLGALCGGLAIALAGHDRRAPIPFGPFLAYAGLLSLFRPGPWW